MLERPVHLDVTELVNMGLRTGIQRVERELIRHWPGPSPLVLCAYEPSVDDLVALPAEAASILTSTSDASHHGDVQEHAALQRVRATASPTPICSDNATILNAELFFHSGRTLFYERLASEGRHDVRWLIYDFLPYLRPDWFAQGTGRNVMPYLRALRSIPRVAFISQHTRQDYLGRVMRNSARDGPVIALGGDGLGLERQTFSGNRNNYVVLGSVEPRKRVEAVLEAFAQLWSEGSQARLTVIGRLLPHAQREIALLGTLRSHPLFHHMLNASDKAICVSMRTARAMIFASEGEGFGLPPFEALFCGIPVIVGPNVPSVEMLPACGQIRIDRIAPELIADAVREMQDDAVAKRLWDGAARLSIPTCRDFARTLAAWAQAA